MADLTTKITDFKALSADGQAALDKYNLGVEKAAVINGKLTGIRVEADIERVILSMGGVKGVSATFPESVGTFPLGKDARLQVMEIKGLKPEDVTTLVDNLNKKGMTIDPKTDVVIGKDGVANIVLKTSEMTEKLLPEMKKEFEKLGKENPELLRDLQKQTTKALMDQGIKPSGIPLWQSPAEEVQNSKSTTAEKVKVGEVGHGSQFALKVGNNNEETIRGSADYKIMQDKDGKLTAQVDLGHGSPQTLKSTDTVKQQVTAMMDGVNGEAPKRVTFDVGKDGALTPQAQATPQGKGQDAEQQQH